MTAPQNEITRTVTASYLSGLDPDNPPLPSVIEDDLINKTNAQLAMANATRASKAEHSPLLKTLSFSQIADILLRLHHIIRLAPSDKNTDRDYDLLAMYVTEGTDKGIYVTSEDYIRSVARQYNYELSTNQFKEILAAIKDQAPRATRCQNPNLIAVNNGIFDYETKMLLPFSHDRVFISKSSVDYVEGAVSPIIYNDDDGSRWEIEEWMTELSDDGEVVHLLWEIIGAIIRPHVRWNKSAWFYSERGNNGKGTLVALMRNICGSSSYASIPIEDFGKEFMLEPLTRASAILVDENNVGTFVDKAANLKAIITNDVISINRKHKTPIAYQFWGFMVQCLNEFPKVKDKSESFYRRQLFVPFEKNFTGQERRYIKDDYLNRTDVLQYVLQRVLHMNYSVLSEPESTKLALDRYKEFNDPVRAFWEEVGEQFTWDLLPWEFLYELFKKWFQRNSPSGTIIGSSPFKKDLTAIVDADQMWRVITSTESPARAGSKISRPEPMLNEYEIVTWLNDRYKGNTHLDLRCTPSALRTNKSYRGLMRVLAPLPLAVNASLGIDTPNDLPDTDLTP